MIETAQKKTALYDEHVKLRAQMVPFAGWLMPVQYTSIVEEHQAVRKNIGMFDISHMGQLIVEGKGARAWLNTMLTNNVDKLEVGQGQYTFLLNDKGGIIDDLIAYRIGDAKFLLVVNASCTEQDLTWLNQHKRGDVKIDNRSANFGGVAIQGPRIAELFVNLPARNHIVDLELEGMPISMARTGYTGEDGVEVFFRVQDAVKFWNTVLENGKNLGIRPCGLASASTRSISTTEKRVFSGTAITPSHAHAYTSSRYSASFGRSRANRSPAAKPCRLSAAATRATRPWSSPKVSRVAPEETAGRSEKYRAARPRECT